MGPPGWHRRRRCGDNLGAKSGGALDWPFCASAPCFAAQGRAAQCAHATQSQREQPSVEARLHHSAHWPGPRVTAAAPPFLLASADCHGGGGRWKW